MVVIGVIANSDRFDIYSHEKTPGSVTVFPPQAFFTFNLLLTRFKNITAFIKPQVYQVTVRQLDTIFFLLALL
jgi:hypothetical protein